MRVIVPISTVGADLDKRLETVGLGIISKQGELWLVVRNDHPDIFGHSAERDVHETRETQQIDP